MSDAVLSATIDGFRVDVVYDTDPENNPRDWDNLGTLVCWHRRYNLGDKQVRSTAELHALVPKNAIKLAVYLYDHSGITISTAPYSDEWDSGRVGLIFCTKAEAYKEFRSLRVSAREREARALDVMRQEIKTYDAFLTGQVFGFRVFGLNGEELDSCWGFVGAPEYALEEGKAVAKGYASDPKRMLQLEGVGL